MENFTLRIPDGLMRSFVAESKAAGIKPSIFIRQALAEKIARGPDRTEERLNAIHGDLRTLFAYFDAFVKSYLACIPEPADKAAAVERAKERHKQLLAAVSKNLE
jgi:hypothetical protein